MKANLYKLLCLVLALCLMLSISPAASAGELTDAELDAIISGGLTQDQINDLVNGGELDTLLPSGPGNLIPGTDKNDAYIPETLPVFPDQPVGGTANVVFPFEPSLCRTVKETADEVLTYLDARNTDFTVYFWTNEADISALVEKILDMAQTHTGREKLGDYLRFHIAGYNVSMNSYEWSGKTYVKAVFQVTYYTTAQQEQELEQKFNQVMASLNLSGKSDYEKVKAIYDYITSHVTYDHDHKNNANYYLQFSAYAALVQGTAVCQGYANLFYRMALAAGLDCRIVTGWGQNEDHGWNIVRVDGKYYNVDPTWDAGRSDYKYFLKSNKDFPEHTVNFEKHGQRFFSDYPISEANYDPAQATGVIDSGKCGTNASWKLTADGTLTISGTGFMDNYSSGTAPWYKYRKETEEIVGIKQVVIGEGIKSIGNHAFENCHMTAVVLPDTLTRIGDYAFAGSYLTNVAIPEGVSTLSQYAFYKCAELTGTTIPGSVETIEECAFTSCSKLKTVSIGEGVKKIGDSVFAGCTALDGIRLPASVNDLGKSVFSSCSSLTGITIPEGVGQIKASAFFGCENLRDIELPNSVYFIGESAFQKCTSLTGITIPEKVGTIEKYTFEGCTSLTNVELPEKVWKIGQRAFENCTGLITLELNVEEIESYAFTGCTGLTSVTMHRAPILRPGVFAACTALKNVVIKAANKSSRVMLSTNAFAGCKSLQSVTIDGRTEIGQGAFRNCTGLTKITFLGNAPDISEKAEYSDEIFLNVTATAYYPADNSSWKEEIMKDYGGDIAWLPLGGTDEHVHTPIASASKMDATCTTDGSLLTITRCETCGEELGREVTVIPAHGHAAQTPVRENEVKATCEKAGGFDEVVYCAICKQELSRTAMGAPALGHVYQDGKCARCGEADPDSVPDQTVPPIDDIPQTDILASGKLGENITWKLTAKGTLTISGTGSIKDLLLETNPWEDYKDKITDVIVEPGITDLFAMAFENCTKLKTVSLPDTLTFIDMGAFSYCTALEEINLPDNMEVLAENLFSGCKKLKNLTLPKNLEGIGFTALADCTSLKKITIPAKVDEIRLSAFAGCTGLKEIVFLGDAPSFMELEAVAGIFEGVTATAYYPSGNNTWTKDVMKDYGGNITWKPNTETCDHLEVTVTAKTEPTCTQAGKTETVTTCQKCGEELDRKTAIIPALNHDFQNGACTRCGQEDHEHVEGQPVQEILTQPTCTEDGRYVNVCYCTVCGQELKRDETPTSIPKLGHKKAEAVEENRTEPICTAAGSVDYVVYCATCGQELNREKVTLPKLGHNEGQPTEENRVEATCAAAGSYDLVTRCAHCGVILSSDTITLPTPDHTWDEGKVTNEPTQVPHGEKTYTCTVCGETRVEKLEHVHSYTDNIVRPTCEKPGYTEHTCACGRRYEDDHVKALGHDYEEGLCTVCGGKDPTYRPPVEEADRCAGADRFSTALLAADRMKENLGLEKFDAVVVASGTNFADALSGSYLATVMDAPILLTYTTDKVNDPIKEYIRENLIKGGTVYILGGTGAVPESFEDGLYGFRVKRLAGESRFETNLKILEEAGVEDQPILVCTGLNFADSLSASATKLPVLLVWNELSKEQTAFLESLSGNKIYILGGEGAVSAKMHKQLSYYSPVTRLGGRDRFETSAMIAREFFEKPSSAVLAYAWNFPDGLCGGPLAASMNAPLLLTMEGYEKYAAAYTKVNSISDGIVLGGESLIPETTASLIFRQ